MSVDRPCGVSLIGAEPSSGGPTPQIPQTRHILVAHKEDAPEAGDHAAVYFNDVSDG
jgi:hypothetical protein